MSQAVAEVPESQPQPTTGLELSVIAPCFNEALNIPELSQRLLAMFDGAGIRGEVVLVDDGSADDTARVIREHSRKDPRVVGVFHRINRGMAGAWRSGANAARGAHVAIIDADLQYQPEDVLRLYRTLLESSVEVVQGWRSSVGRERGLRYSLSRGFNTILNSAFGMSLRDNKSGFVCCAREVMQDLLTYQSHYAYWQSFLMVAAHAKGYSYKEIEAIFEDRKQGHSFLEGRAMRATARCLVDVGTALWEYRVRTQPYDLSRNFLKKEGAELDEPPSLRANPARFRAYEATLPRTHGIRARHAESYYETLTATQFLSPQQIRDLQDEKLRRLVRRAYRGVPYYRARMQAGTLTPEDIRTQDDLNKLPFLTRVDVRKHLYFDIMQEGVSQADLLKLTMSGRSGEPFMVFADQFALEYRWAAAQRFRDWTGHRFGEKVARFWSEGVGLHEAQATKARLDARLSNRLLLPAFRLDEASISASLRAIAKHRAVLIEGPVETLEAVATQLLQQGGVAHQPKAVLVHGQNLTEAARATIEGAFGCKVFNLNRLGEFAELACETDSHDGLFVSAEGYIVEVLVDGRPALPGERGEVFVTDLNNRCMPLIRYGTGDSALFLGRDSAELHPRGLPRIAELSGRAGVIYQGNQGERLPSAFLSALFAEYGFAIRRYRATQPEPGSLSLRIERGARYSDATLDDIKRRIRERLGAGLDIGVDFDEPTELTEARRSSPLNLRVGGR